MKIKKIPPRKAWSYSQWSNYHSCPFKYLCGNVNKLQQPSSPAMARGNMIHKKAEDYLLGKIKKLPEELQKFEVENPGAFSMLRELEMLPEERWGLTKDWNETEWVAPDTWLRVITDVHGYNYEDELLMIDYKTGRKYPGHKNQESLYATAVFNLYPETEKVRAEFWYLDQGFKTSTLYHKRRAKSMTKEWNVFANKTLNDPICAPTPSANACKWCAFKKEEGGPCKF